MRPQALHRTRYGIILYMLGLGTWGFGGPVALVGYMYRDLVERRNWFTEADYKEGLALAQLMPGPLVAQLAIYLGFVHYRLLGATLIGLAFVLPSFAMVVGLGVAYEKFGGLAWMQAVFYSVGACVIGIISISAYKLTTKNIGKDTLLWGICATSAIVTFVTQSEELWLFIGSGVLVWLLRAPPAWISGHKLHSTAAPVISFFALNGLGATGANWSLFRLRWNLRIWQRTSHRAIPVLGCRQGVRMADGPSVRRCCCSGHDYARTGGHHNGIYWLFGVRLLGCRGRSHRNIPAVLLAHRNPRTVLQKIWESACIGGIR